MRWPRSWRLFVLVLMTGAAACRTNFGYTPVARIVVTPQFVPQGDAYHTDVTLDGRTSADPLNSPDAGFHDLTFAWSFSGDDVRVAQGSASSPMLVVHVAGARTVQVTLTVTSPGGESTTAMASVGLTVPASDGGARE